MSYRMRKLLMSKKWNKVNFKAKLCCSSNSLFLISNCFCNLLIVKCVLIRAKTYKEHSELVTKRKTEGKREIVEEQGKKIELIWL
jgi:hypothetical protein